MKMHILLTLLKQETSPWCSIFPSASPSCKCPEQPFWAHHSLHPQDCPYLYMKGATVAVLGWLYCCWGWGSCTLTVLLPVVWVVTMGPFTAWLLLLLWRPPTQPLPSEEARLEEELEWRPSSWDFWCESPELAFPPRLLSPSFAGTGALEDFPVVFFIPGFGIPLCKGAEASFLALLSFPPLGIKLAILEVFFGISVVVVRAVCSSLGSSFRSSFSVMDVLFAMSLLLSFSFSFCFSFSFSLPFGELFLLVSARLKVLCAIPLSAILGLLDTDPGLFTFWLGASISSLSSKLRSVSSFSQLLSREPGHSCVVPPALEPPLLLKSFSFSSMDFWLLGAVLAISEGGFGGSTAGCFTDNMEDVAVCLALRDLLRQGLTAELGWGMAEELLHGTALLQPWTEDETFSFIPVGWEAVLSAGSGKKNPQKTTQKTTE